MQRHVLAAGVLMKGAVAADLAIAATSGGGGVAVCRRFRRGPPDDKPSAVAAAFVAGVDVAAT